MRAGPVLHSLFARNRVAENSAFRGSLELPRARLCDRADLNCVHNSFADIVIALEQ